MKPYILVVRSRHDPSGEIITKLLIEPQETRKIGEKGEVEEAQLRIRYRIIGAALPGARKQTYEFPACYDRKCGESGRICLTGSNPFEGAVFLDPEGLRGNRVGSFIMNKIVEWATSWPDAEINQIKLFSHQGRGENKVRRNRLYEQFGIKFDYTDHSHAEGLAHPMQARSLTPWTQLPDNLSVIGLDQFIDEQEKQLFSAQLDQKGQQIALRQLSLAADRSFAHPIWFAVTTIWTKHTNLILSSIFIVAVLILWWKYIVEIIHTII